jgi:hypothetical protein
MLGTYTYNEIFRKTVIAFGTLFNNIEIRRKNNSVVEAMKVPLGYGNQQKWLARLRQIGNLEDSKKSTAITLPRMAFEMTSISYDASRKVSPTQTVRGADGKTVYMPVPYNLGFTLSVLTKNQDDGLQVVEQILPYFQPFYSITVNVLPEIGEKKDFPVTLNDVSYQDDYEGDYEERRTLIYTLTFTVKTYIYGPVTDNSGKEIKKAIVDTYSTVDPTAARELRYSVEPDPETADWNDDFGFNELFEEFTDGRQWNPVTGQDEPV